MAANLLNTMPIEGIAHIIEALIAALGFFLAVYVFVRREKDKTIEKLAKQIAAYYVEEQEAIAIIQGKKTLPENLNKESARSIKLELRSRAQNNPDSYGEYPNMTAKEVRRYVYWMGKEPLCKRIRNCLRRLFKTHPQQLGPH